VRLGAWSGNEEGEPEEKEAIRRSLSVEIKVHDLKTLLGKTNLDVFHPMAHTLKKL
jgi:hypothetical protein